VDAHARRAARVTIAATLLAATLGVAAPAPAQERSTTGTLPFRGESQWTDDRGRVVRLSDFAGRRTILTMAYPNCRRTCSFTLKKLVSLQDEADRNAQPVEIVVVSLDPARDDAQAWRQYRQRHHLSRANWHFLTGGEADTRDLARWIGLGEYWKYDDHVLHDFGMVVIDTAGRVERRLGYADLTG
jgi:protein SCO1